jgi:Uma2 family endonuclease
MSASPIPRLTPEEYLELERKAEFKSEYYDGQMYAMAGGKSPHNLIASNALIRLGGRLPDRCIAYNSDQRVGIGEGRAYVYPDVTVVCGKPQIAGLDDILLNPVIIIEVLSESTEAHDRGYKWSLYRELDSLREYVLVWQKQPRVEIFRRDSGKWTFDEFKGHDANCRFESVGVEVPLAEIYRGIEFASTAA